MIEIGFKLVSPNAKMPTKAHDKGDSCFDLYAAHDAWLWPQGIDGVSTGLILEIPEGWGGFIWDRSGLAVNGVTTRGGVIDSNYRDIVKVIMTNEIGGLYLVSEVRKINTGDRIAQIDFRPIYDVSFKEIEEINRTGRNGGFGSSGK